MIQLYNVSKYYDGTTPALLDISLVVRAGAFVYITGSSGAGKSTLLKILYRGERFTKGQVIVNNINVARLSDSKLHLLRRNIGVVFQEGRLIPGKSIFENVAFAQEVIGVARKTIREKTWEALKSVGLSHKKDCSPLQLSGGEQQRVSIARALVNEPKILLADEPTGNLDSKIEAEVLDLFERANRRGATIIFATHSQDIIQSRRHPVIKLERGRIIDPGFSQ